MLGNPAVSGGNPAGATILPTGNPTQNYIDTYATYYSLTPTPAPRPWEGSFSAYQDWFPEYPTECVVKVSPGNISYVNYVRPEEGNTSIESTYPDNIVYSYDPAPPKSDVAPNPNGTSGSFSGTGSGGYSGALFPRWHTDAPYDMANASSYDYWRDDGWFPIKNHDYIILPTGFTSPKPWSASLTVTNLQSEVYNEQTLSNEYYTFTQETFNYEQTGHIIIPVDWSVCCWNDGTVINGSFSFSSIDVTAVARGDPFNPSYGFTGMTATTGSTITAAGSADFSVTISSSYTPVTVDIPVVSGKISFITDFWITSVVSPS